jgi:hypothetical protein
MLLVVMGAAKADPKGVVRFLALTGSGGGSKMRKFNPHHLAFGNAAPVRPDPAPVARPDFLNGGAHPHLGSLEPGRQPGGRW